MTMTITLTIITIILYVLCGLLISQKQHNALKEDTIDSDIVPQFLGLFVVWPILVLTRIIRTVVFDDWNR